MRIEYRLRYVDYLLFTLIHQFLSIPLQVLYLLFAAWVGSTWIETEPVAIGVIIL